MLRRVLSTLSVIGLVVLLLLAALLAATALGWIALDFDVGKLTLTVLVLEAIAILADRLFGILERRAKPDDAVEPLPPTPSQRDTMLNQVEQQWIRSVLERPIHESVMDMLDLSYVDNPLAEGVRYSLEGEERFIRSDADAMGIFNSVGQGHGLLILGEPGAGKTTTMLQLAREQIRQARENGGEPLPIVFTLSSWSPDFERLGEWLAEELKIHYGVRQETGRQWIVGQHLMLLLDGLDEVREDRRDDCVRAINRFREEEGHGLTRTVVCCRSQEYDALEAELSSLSGSITIQPLTEEQVGDFLSRDDLELGAVRAAIEGDPVLRELTTSPLNLSVMAVAYAGKAAEALRPLDTTARRKDLFDQYIVQIFAHRRRKQPKKAGEQKARFAPGSTLHWLAFLARQMGAHDLTRFLIERLQPSWLERQGPKRRFTRWSGLVGGLVVGLVVGLVFGLVVGLVFGLVEGMVGGLVFGLGEGRDGGQIKTVDTVTVSWGKLVFELVVGLVGGLVVGLVVGLVFGPVGGLVVGLVFGLARGLARGLQEGLNREQIDVSFRPNHGIRRTRRNAIRVAAVGGLGGGLLVALLFGARTALLGGAGGIWSGDISELDVFILSWDGFWRGLPVGAAAGPLIGLTVGMFNGGMDVFKHTLLRRLLAKGGHFPKSKDLERFLDYADKLIFIRRTGGSYRFIHSLVQAHFAGLTAGDVEQLVAGIEPSDGRS